MELCLTGDGMLAYAYGKPGAAPELELFMDVAEADYRPWSGIGRTMWYDITLPNGAYGYTLWWSAERVFEETAADEVQVTEAGGITVSRGGETLAELTCLPETITEGFVFLE